MKVYLVIHEDRHADVAVHVHRLAGKAVEHAKQIAAKYPDAEEERVSSWLYACRLSSESDYVHVVESELLP